MNEFAMRPARERAAVFQETAARLGLGRAAIVEKDFWVCWTLRQLFGADGPSNVDVTPPVLLFKGGTSLSKVYRIIDRFSEDVDLTVDRRLLVEAGGDPDESGIPRRERERRIEAIAGKCAHYINETVVPFLAVCAVAWSEADVVIDTAARQTINFRYPRSLTDSAYGGSSYVSAQIRLEFGARGEMWPAERGTVTAYAAQEFPNLFNAPDVGVWALSPKRTFWEKATILHAIACSDHVSGGARQSRHYSDLALIAKTAAGREAIVDVELLNSVATHKAAYFKSAKAHYELAKPGTLRLIPSGPILSELSKDYRRMREMFVGEPTSFESMIGDIAELEAAINANIR